MLLMDMDRHPVLAPLERWNIGQRNTFMFIRSAGVGFSSPLLVCSTQTPADHLFHVHHKVEYPRKDEQGEENARTEGTVQDVSGNEAQEP